MRDGEDYYEGVDVDIIALKNGWTKIKEIRSADGTLISPSGWLPNGVVSFVVQTDLGFANPDITSKIIYADRHWIMPSNIVQILDCKDDWVKLIVTTNDKKQHRAWFCGICLVQETTGDSKVGDYISEYPPERLPKNFVKHDKGV